MVTKGEKEKYWHLLNLMYVTEESDDPDNPNGIIEHKLQWRSKSKFTCYTLSVCVCVCMGIIMHFLQLCSELDDFMAVLDSRLAKNQQRQIATGMVAKKVRKEGAPSDSLPPSDAPSWAIKDSASMCHAVTCTLHCKFITIEFL